MHKLIGYACCLASEALLIGIGRIQYLDALLSLIAHICAAIAGLYGLWHIWRAHGHKARKLLQLHRNIHMTPATLQRDLGYIGSVGGFLNMALAGLSAAGITSPWISILGIVAQFFAHISYSAGHTTGVTAAAASQAPSAPTQG